MSIRLADEQPKDDNRVRIVASTDEEVEMGGYREKLLHGEENVDRSGASSALFNHDRNQVIGGIVSTSLSGGRMTAELEIDPEARGSNGLRILQAVRKGYLRGVSIGYSYRTDDCDVMEDARGNIAVTARKWTLREISITPTPADLSAGVLREAPEFVRAFKAQTEAARMSTEVKTEPAKNADEIAKEREARQKAEIEATRVGTQLKLRDLARSHKIDLSDEEAHALGDCKTEADGTRYLLELKSKRSETQIKTNTSVEVVRDAADKADAAAEDGLMWLAGIRNEKDLGMRDSFQGVGRRWLQARGVDALKFTKNELAAALLGKGPGARQLAQRDAANVTSGQFTSYLLANVQDKLVYGGFNNMDTVTYTKWTKQRSVQDFKTFSGAALDTGNLIQTAENTAFPELLKDEGGYSNTLKMWGAQISLTYEAIVSDDLGQFMEKLAMAGFIARRTIDEKVYTDLAGATWTNRTTADSLDDTALTNMRANMARITGAAGKALGMPMRWLIVPPELRGTALQLTQIAPYVAPNAVIANADIEVISTHHLSTTTTFYGVAPANYDPVVVATLQGVDSPIVEEFDAGAVAARKYKVMMPFAVTIPAPGGNVGAMWRGTTG